MRKMNNSTCFKWPNETVQLTRPNGGLVADLVVPGDCVAGNRGAHSFTRLAIKKKGAFMKRLFISVVGLVLFSGCAFTQQHANLSPTISVVASTEGKNITIAVRVIDERPSQSLGRRGSGYGPAAEITSAQDVAAVVHQQVTDGLRKKGFSPVEYSDTKDPRLTVEVRLLEYSTSQGFWTGGVHVKGALKAIAQRSGRTYEHMYRSEKEENVVIVPTAGTNEQWINSVLTDVLQQMFVDNELFRLLTNG
jgi:uncharacterized lipoprotein YajG